MITMELIIKGEPKEIADLVTEIIQSRQLKVTIDSESVFKKLTAKNDIWKKRHEGSVF